MGRTLKTATAFLVFATIVASPALAETSKTAIKAGPLTLGAALEQNRAEAPDADWTVTYKSEFTGRPMSMSADNAFMFAGGPVKASVQKHYYDWNIELRADVPVSSPLECEQAGLEWFTAVEETAGALSPTGEGDAADAQWVAARTGFRAFTVDFVKGGRRSEKDYIRFGQGSTAEFIAMKTSAARISRKAFLSKPTDRFSLNARRIGEKTEIKASAGLSLDARACVLSAIYVGWRDEPAMTTVAFDGAKVLGTMAVGDRHRLLKNLALPKDGLTIVQRCAVSRQKAQPLRCDAVNADGIDQAVENAAGRIAAAMTFDLSGIDRDDPQQVWMEIPVRLAPPDADAESFGSAARVLMSDVPFAATPPVRDLEFAYPYKAKQAGVGANVRATCKVQSDGSLICISMWVEQTNGLSDYNSDFVRAVEKIIPFYRATPKLKSGAPSAGAVFDLIVQFAVAE